MSVNISDLTRSWFDMINAITRCGQNSTCAAPPLRPYMVTRTLWNVAFRNEQVLDSRSIGSHDGDWKNYRSNLCCVSRYSAKALQRNESVRGTGCKARAL